MEVKPIAEFDDDDETRGQNYIGCIGLCSLFLVVGFSWTMLILGDLWTSNKYPKSVPTNREIIGLMFIGILAFCSVTIGIAHRFENLKVIAVVNKTE